MRIDADRLSYAYVRGRDVLRKVSFSVGAGQVAFLLGANGCGKTTLVECLAGIRTPRSGKVLLDGRSLEQYALRERARRIGLVPQIHEPVYAYTVFDIVLMGRSPHLGLFARPGRRDRMEVRRALEAVGLWMLRHRPYTQTSGGERQLALIARGLAQGATCLLMDEPAAHLDPRHQHDVFRVVTQLASDGFTVLVTSHHPNNALLYGDSAILMIDGAVVAQGSPESVLTAEHLEATYGMPFELIHGPNGSKAVLPKAPR